MAIVVVHGQNILRSSNETKILANTETTLTYVHSQLLDRLVESVKFFVEINYDIEPIKSLDPNEWKLCHVRR